MLRPYQEMTRLMPVLAVLATLTACADVTPSGPGDDGGIPGGGSASGCTTNVDGCDPAAFSCPAARFCYTSAVECQGSGECGDPSGGPTSGCRTNVDGCDPSAFSCDAAPLCYGTALACDASGECG